MPKALTPRNASLRECRRGAPPALKRTSNSVASQNLAVQRLLRSSQWAEPRRSAGPERPSPGSQGRRSRGCDQIRLHAADRMQPFQAPDQKTRRGPRSPSRLRPACWWREPRCSRHGPDRDRGRRGRGAAICPSFEAHWAQGASRRGHAGPRITALMSSRSRIARSGLHVRTT